MATDTRKNLAVRQISLKSRNQSILFFLPPVHRNVHSPVQIVSMRRKESNGMNTWINIPSKDVEKLIQFKLDQTAELISFFLTVQVCKSFVLSTLGFTSDQVITTNLKSPAFTEDAPSNKLKNTVVETIKNRIFSYHPSISHYRHAHAPLCLYLPPELSVKEMHDDYISKYPESPVHYNVYREYIKKYNIGFTKWAKRSVTVVLSMACI